MNGERLIIPADIARQMRAHAERIHPHECCGIMIGAREGGVSSIAQAIPADNQNSERAHDRFEIDPRFYMKTERAVPDGQTVLGFYHSHPDCPNVPSETDRAYALGWPGFLWLIFRVDQAKTVSDRTWVLNSSGLFYEIETSIEKSGGKRR